MTSASAKLNAKVIGNEGIAQGHTAAASMDGKKNKMLVKEHKCPEQKDKAATNSHRSQHNCEVGNQVSVLAGLVPSDQAINVRQDLQHSAGE